MTSGTCASVISVNVLAVLLNPTHPIAIEPIVMATTAPKARYKRFLMPNFPSKPEALDRLLSADFSVCSFFELFHRM